MKTKYKITPFTNKKLTQVSSDDGEWTCLCGNTASSDGFTPISPNGELRDMGTESQHYRCNQCGRVIRDADGWVIGTTSEAPKTPAAKVFLRNLADLMLVFNVRRLTGVDDGRIWIVFEWDSESNHAENEPFDLSVEELKDL